MIKIITRKKYAALLDEIESLRRQVVEENRAKYAALRRLAELKKAKSKNKNKNTNTKH